MESCHLELKLHKYAVGLTVVSFLVNKSIGIAAISVHKDPRLCLGMLSVTDCIHVWKKHVNSEEFLDQKSDVCTSQQMSGESYSHKKNVRDA